MKYSFLFLALLLITSSISAQQGETVEPAFEGLSEFPKVRDLSLSADGKEAYFTLQSPLEEISVIARSQKKGDKWSEPETLSFSGEFKELEPYLSLDGLKLYFASTRPIDDTGTEPKDFDIWYVDRASVDAPWGDPVNIGSPINSEHNEFYPAITSSGNLYFTSDRPDTKGKDNLFLCTWEKGKFADPVSLDTTINSPGFEYNAYVAPDESYLIFGGYNRPDGFGSGDMYISFRVNGKWGQAMNLGEEINSKSMDFCPYVDQKTQTLYFTSRRSSLKKVNEIANIDEFRSQVNSYQNGNSRLYKVSFGKELAALKKKAGAMGK